MKYIYGLLILLFTNTQTSSWTRGISASGLKKNLNPYTSTEAANNPSFTQRLKSYLARPFKTGTRTTKTVYERLKPKAIEEAPVNMDIADNANTGIRSKIQRGAQKLWHGTKQVGAGIGAGAAGIGTTAAGLATHYVARPAIAVGSLGIAEIKKARSKRGILQADHSDSKPQPNKHEEYNDDSTSSAKHQQDKPKHPLPKNYQQPQKKQSEEPGFFDDLEERGDEAAPVMKKPQYNLYNPYNINYAHK